MRYIPYAVLLLTAALAALKLGGILAWSWWVVLTPAIALAALMIALFVGIVMLADGDKE